MKKPRPAPPAGRPRSPAEPPRRPRPYERPRLERFGDVRDLTLSGATAGVGDSVPFTRV